MAPLERRVTASYLIAFGAVLVVFALAVHVAFAVVLDRDASAALDELLVEGANSVEIRGGKAGVDEDTVQIVNPRAQGVAWYTARGRRIAHVGMPFDAAAPARDVSVRTAAAPRAPAPRPDDPAFVRAATSRAAERAELAELDVGLAVGLCVALVAATVGGRLLARRAIERVSTTVRTLRDFTADAAHELRGPLTALGGNADASLRDAGDLPPAHRRRLETIADTARDLARTVDDLLLLARAEAPIERELFAVDLGERARRSAARREALAAERNIALDLSAPRTAIYGDPADIDRIVDNLVDNALRYTPPGGRVSIACGPERAGAILRVSDTGTGIEPGDLPKIFDRFWRAERARSEAGTGLGLAIVRALARRHGGDVSVKSAPGAGAEFTVWLPLRPPQSGLHDFSTAG